MDTVSAALQKNGFGGSAGVTTKAVERWYKEMPREEEMLPKDKYTIFDRKERKYRKGIHSECIDLVRDCCVLTRSRTTQVDESQSEGQSSWFLRYRHEDHGLQPTTHGCVFKHIRYADAS